VVTFAVSNAFLSWLNPVAASNVVLFAAWNGLLASYLGFAFLQAWIRSVFRWYRTGDSSPRLRTSPRWTALGVAEATVVVGTVAGCLFLTLEKASNRGLDGNDWARLATIVLITGASAFAVGRLWRRDRHGSSHRADIASEAPVEPAP
jgi:hypothetical protein